jgi:hypothetical protein
LKKYPDYFELRKSQKLQWRKNRPAHQYQSEYRQSHPIYAETNRKQQLLRNKNAQKKAMEYTNRNIVKTDALTAESLSWRGLYEILPYRTHPDKKIVKTDALIVEIRAHRGFGKVMVPQSG